MRSKSTPLWSYAALTGGLAVLLLLPACGGGGAPPGWVTQGHAALVRDGRHAIYGLGMTSGNNLSAEGAQWADRVAVGEVREHARALLDRIIQEFGYSLNGNPDFGENDDGSRPEREIGKELEVTIEIVDRHKRIRGEHIVFRSLARLPLKTAKPLLRSRVLADPKIRDALPPKGTKQAKSSARELDKIVRRLAENYYGTRKRKRK